MTCNMHTAETWDGLHASENYTQDLFCSKKAFWSFLTALRCDALSRIWNAFGIQGDFLLCLFKNKTGQERCYCQRKGEMDTFLRICVKYKVVNLLIHTMKSFFSWNLHEIFFVENWHIYFVQIDKKKRPLLRSKYMASPLPLHSCLPS